MTTTHPLITRCPQCQTRFRVASQQLAVRQGLLRCGHCAAVFNGFATLGRDENEAVAEARSTEGNKTRIAHLPGPIESAQAPAPALVSTGQTSESARPEQKNSRWHHLQGRLNDALPLPLWTPPSDREAEPTSEDAEQSISSRPVLAASPPSPTSRGAEIVNGELPSIEAMQAFADSLEGVDASEASSAAKDKPAANEGQPPQAHAPRADPILFRPDLYERPQAKRGSWLAALLLLGLLLAAQAIYFLRSDIAAQWPPLKSYLADLCRPFGCQVSLPRQIDQLTIEASELQADPGRPNVVSVTAIIRNRGTTEQAYPTLEITLTDTLDRPLARRSLDAVDYSPESAQRQEGIAAGAEVIAKTAIETPRIKPSGYRLRLYYR